MVATTGPRKSTLRRIFLWWSLWNALIESAYIHWRSSIISVESLRPSLLDNKYGTDVHCLISVKVIKNVCYFVRMFDWKVQTYARGSIMNVVIYLKGSKPSCMESIKCVNKSVSTFLWYVHLALFSIYIYLTDFVQSCSVVLRSFIYFIIKT